MWKMMETPHSSLSLLTPPPHPMHKQHIFTQTIEENSAGVKERKPVLAKVALLINSRSFAMLRRTFYYQNQAGRGEGKKKNTNGMSEPSALQALLDKEAY